MQITLHQCAQKIGAVSANMPQGSGDTLHVWPELTLAGYMPEDLVYRADFVAQCQSLPQTGDHLFGTIHDQKNVARLTSNGALLGQIVKHNLPNYGVFDEQRVFQSGTLPTPIPYKNMKLGVLICEDMWFPQPAANLKKLGADILIVINGSPYETDKHQQRLDIARARVSETNLPLIYLNRTGGQDELVFDGQSFGLQSNGDLAFCLPAFTETTIDLEFSNGKIICSPAITHTTRTELDYTALVTGTRDYVLGNGFKSVLLGLSGGVDSAFVAAIACDALGADNVHCLGLPSRYTAQQSYDDAHALVKNLGCRFDIIPLENAMQSLHATLGDEIDSGLAHENIQSRLRGLILMAHSNAKNAMVLATGNKSEYAVGYSTLYGDMCGGYAPLKDVYKTHVYALCQHRGNIPQAILDRAPTAELAPNQTDQDTLPPYPVLDAILEQFIEGQKTAAEIIAAGFATDTVHRVIKLLHRAEFKRRQSAPGPKITRRAFGRDRRYPISQGYA